MKKILLVEDDSSIRNNIEIFLKIEGFHVDAVSNGLEALRITDKELPDLIISDIMMPYFDGIELYERILQKYGDGKVPFVFLTSNNDSISIRKGLKLDEENYITKPFELYNLLTVINNQIAKKNSGSGEDTQLKSDPSQKSQQESPLPLTTNSDIPKNTTVNTPVLQTAIEKKAPGKKEL